MPSSPSPPPTEKRRCTRERLPFRVWCDAASFLRPRELGRLERCHRAFATVSNAVGRDAFLARMAGFGFHPRQAADFYAASRRRCGVVRRRGVGPALHMPSAWWQYIPLAASHTKFALHTHSAVELWAVWPVGSAHAGSALHMPSAWWQYIPLDALHMTSGTAGV